MTATLERPRPARLPAVSPRKATWFVRLFGLTKIPLIGYVRPRVMRWDEEEVVIKVPLGRRTRNHLGSMYFGALAIGADLAAGLVAMRIIQEERANGGAKVDFVFKDVRGEFLRRPDGDVHFISRENTAVRALVAEAIRTRERVERPMPIECVVPGNGSDGPVARFVLTISLKRRA